MSDSVLAVPSAGHEPTSTVPQPDEATPDGSSDGDATGLSSDGPATTAPTTTTTPMPDPDLLSQLLAKVAQLEKQAELDRQKRLQQDQLIMAQTLPVASLPSRAVEECCSETGGCGRINVTNHMKNNTMPNSYFVSAIQSYEQGIVQLKKEEERITSMIKERDLLRLNYKSKEEEWDEERRDLLRKLDKLEQTRQLHQAAQADQGNPQEPPEQEPEPSQDPEDQDVAPPTTDDADKDTPSSMLMQQTPSLNYVDWDAFCVKLHLDEVGQVRWARIRYAVDVLVGEPVVTFELPQNNWLWATRNRQQPQGRKNADAKAKSSKPPASTTAMAKQQPSSGQAPLPERIRIRSKYILKILEAVVGKSMAAEDTYGTTSGVVMIRPYKLLTYYNDAIHQRLADLDAKFNPKASVPDDTAPDAALDKADEAGGPTAAETKSDATKASKEEPEDEFVSSLTAYQHLTCLVAFMDGEIQAKMAHLASDRCRTVSFQDVWYLFKPGDEVVEQSRRQAYKVISVQSSGHKLFPPWRVKWDKAAKEAEDTPVTLKCVYVDFDGKRLGPRSRTIRIPRFDGEKLVTALEVFPLRFAETKGSPNTPTLRQKLVERGRMFVDVTSFQHMHYSGPTLDTREDIDSHVVIDFDEAFAAKKRGDQNDGNAMEKPQLSEDLINPQESTEDEEKCAAGCCANEDVHNDQYIEQRRNQEYLATLVPENREVEPPLCIYPRPLRDINPQENAVGESDLVIMSYRVFGFVLRSRKWGEYGLFSIVPILLTSKPTYPTQT